MRTAELYNSSRTGFSLTLLGFERTGTDWIYVGLMLLGEGKVVIDTEVREYRSIWHKQIDKFINALIAATASNKPLFFKSSPSEFKYRQDPKGNVCLSVNIDRDPYFNVSNNYVTIEMDTTHESIMEFARQLEAELGDIETQSGYMLS